MIFNRSGKKKNGEGSGAGAGAPAANGGIGQNPGFSGNYFQQNAAAGYGTGGYAQASPAAGNNYAQGGYAGQNGYAAGGANAGQTGYAGGAAGSGGVTGYSQAGTGYGAGAAGNTGYAPSGAAASGAYGAAGYGQGAYGASGQAGYNPSAAGQAGYGANAGQTGYSGAYGQAGFAAGNAGSGAYAQGQTGFAGGSTGSGAYRQVQTGYAAGASGAYGASMAGSGAYPAGNAGNPAYGAGNTAYGAAGTGYAGYGASQAAGGYNPAGYGAGAPNGGYAAPNGGYTGGQNGYGYGAPQGGYTGYGAPGGYGYGGQNPGGYAQMGRGRQNAPQGTAGQIPLNGGGYVPPPVRTARGSFQMNDAQLYLTGAVLVILFIVGFVTKISAVLWVFAALAVAMTVLLWVKPMTAANKRLCFTIIFAALAAVAVVQAAGLIRGGSAGGGTDPTATPVPSESAAAAAPAGSQVVIDPNTGEVVATVAVEAGAAETNTPVPEDNTAADRLESFFYYWSVNKYDEMLTLCLPSWLSSVDNPKPALFGLLANRTPLDYTMERISGTADDSSRTVTVTSTMDRNNGKDPVKYRLSVLMARDGDQWFVDPQSLKTYEAADKQDPASIATETPSPTPPTPANTVLYYNPGGGTKYHLDPNCKSTHAKYLPFKGHFTYAEVNDDAYKDLDPCNVCNAPLRPNY